MKNKIIKTIVGLLILLGLLLQNQVVHAKAERESFSKPHVSNRFAPPQDIVIGSPNIPTPPEVVDASTSNNKMLNGFYLNYKITETCTADDWCVYDGQESTQIQCLAISGNYIYVKNLTIENCSDHGFFIDRGASTTSSNGYVIGDNLIIRHNGGACVEDSWPSGDKREKNSHHTVLRNSQIYGNCGEGTGMTMSTYGWSYNNEYRDNWSVDGGYLDNGDHLYFYDNIVRDTNNPYTSRFNVGGREMNSCAGFGAEPYEEYGWFNNHLNYAVIWRNKFYNCKTPVGIWNPTGVTIDQTVVVAENDFFNVSSSTLVALPGALVYGNRLNPTTTLTPTTPIPPTITRTNTPSRTPTATFTATRTPTVTNTPTITVAVTRTQTPTPTYTKTVTPTTIVSNNLCVKVTWLSLLNVRPSASMFNSAYLVNISPNAIVPVEAVIYNNEGTFAQINNRMFFAMYLKSNGKNYAVNYPCT